ncbi:penicillin-binding protein 2 [Mesonia sp. K7]|uniref:penicillin-binding protein 2 n=1 Tax=Mesonia sp. K7 TaxID=2218606 RepID=UPI000DAA9B3C|nr:penicillin-binding protein 2 [Mesonia sp. K7]PZD79620.1 penicillin-binding protein 2 [Mesonia sp. K7]
MRKILPLTIIVLTSLVFIGRLFYLQIVDTSYAVLSANNAIKIEYNYPQRGYVFDRNGELLVANQPSYDVMVIPRQVKPFDTLEFSTLLNISKEFLIERLDKAKVYSPRLPSVVIPQLTKDEFAYLKEKLRKFEGFYIQKRSLREYHVSHSASVLGYISEVTDSEVKSMKYYNSGDNIGRSGVEKQYEEVLRGIKGVKYIQKDNFNREIGPYKSGTLDTLPVRGKDITLTLDARLQAYAEKLMQGKRGGIVAIEPQTGEILSLVTAPYYDPALLVGRKRSKNFTRLWYDTISKPLFNRPLQAMYPPGSPFKALTGLVALEEGVINTSDKVDCHHGFYYGRNARMGCHNHPAPLSITPALAHSCNAFFAKSHMKIINKFDTSVEGMDAWNKHMKSFGLGDYLGNDLPVGQPGRIPDGDYYTRKYNTKRWYSTYTLSSGIGQGEVLTTPIQLANVTAAIANRGWFYTPHILKEIDGKPIKDKDFTVKNMTTVKPANFEPIIEGMHDVYRYGTAYSLRIPDIEICGKTGTAENFIRLNGKKTQLTDHSIFIAFAPKDDPKIAIAVFIENGYWGSRYAGKIASLMIEKYIKDEITRTDLEDWILSHSLEDEYAKPYSGEPFKINQ